MRPPSSFRRGGFGDEPTSHLPPDPKHFIQVPIAFTQGLSPEQWKGLQEIYRTAWEKAVAPPEPPESFGASSYDI